SLDRNRRTLSVAECWLALFEFLQRIAQWSPEFATQSHRQLQRSIGPLHFENIDRYGKGSGFNPRLPSRAGKGAGTRIMRTIVVLDPHGGPVPLQSKASQNG